jgi:acyl CoA:acetate/3-ketoacid CoA transferase beta subunit
LPHAPEALGLSLHTQKKKKENKQKKKKVKKERQFLKNSKTKNINISDKCIFRLNKEKRSLPSEVLKKLKNKYYKQFCLNLNIYFFT